MFELLLAVILTGKAVPAVWVEISPPAAFSTRKLLTPITVTPVDFALSNLPDSVLLA